MYNSKFNVTDQTHGAIREKPSRSYKLRSRYGHSHPSYYSPKLSCSMSDEFTLKVSFFAGVLVVVFLFVSQYFWRDPVVSFSSRSLLIYSITEQSYTFSAWRYPNRRIF